MLNNMLAKVFGNKNERYLKTLAPLVKRINSLEGEMQAMDDAGLAAKTGIFRERLDKGESLDNLLPEAFAVVREASVRTLGLRPYDVQLMGGIVLHQGQIAEMKTGEGKTLVAPLTVYLNALSGKGVHVVTVNDYLARRDADWMGKLYQFLGLTFDTILHGKDDEARKAAYGADVTYGTNNEFGFDYLRDNMKFAVEDFCQRPFNYAIVDEVDCILIDEARTPLIISGPAEMSTELYYQVNGIIGSFEKETHYVFDEKARSVSLSEEGVALGEKLLKLDNLYDPRNIEWLHHLNQALKAHLVFQRDVDYLLQNGQVVIVDEFTGRTMPGRRYSDGLHQALEAKEGVKVEQENQTLASITFQNYFRMYKKLAGMTGTADTEAAEFKKIYNLGVVVIPTHNPMIRIDYPDVVYKNTKAKFRAVVREIEELHKKGQPILVGTVNIDISEKISVMLKKQGIQHSVLNAKHHEHEAEIIADAGQKGRVTIATNMAGRGTDIKLGEGLQALGGLHILGTGRHESRRIDNQLRGRSGRQGDPGSSRFFLSLEDDLLRVFGSDRISSIMDKLGMEEDEAIEHKMISKAIENAQRKVEGHHFDIRKHLLEYDDVMNKQREIIYGQRREVLDSDSVQETVEGMIEDMVAVVAADYFDDKLPSEDWAWDELDIRLKELFGLKTNWDAAQRTDLDQQGLHDLVVVAVKEAYGQKVKEAGEEAMRHLERYVLLQMVDTHWKEHLLHMDHLKEGIGLRGYGQKDPLNEYKQEGYEMFMAMVGRVKEKVVSTLFRIQLVQDDEIDRLAKEQREKKKKLQMSHGNAGQAGGSTVRDGKKVGRNTPCPCDSGKKYKHCCGRKG